MILSFIIFHLGISLVVFILVILFANLTSYRKTYIEKDWELIKGKFKNRLKQNYFLSKQSDYILIRLKFLDNRLLKNSIKVESSLRNGQKGLLVFSGRTDLTPLGFVFCVFFSFMFYIGVFYIYIIIIIKKARQRELKEMQFVANIYANI